MTIFWKQDLFIAALITFFVFGGGIWLEQNQSNNYYEVTAQNVWTYKTAFLKDYNGYFNELIPTKNGKIIALPPLPLLPSLIGSRLNLGEIQTTRLGIGIIIGLMYLILRNQGLSKLKAFLSALLYLIVTPLLFFIVEPGYWQTAQVWGIVGTEFALLFLLKDHYFWAGIGTAIAILSRLNLGVLTAFGFSVYILKNKRIKGLILYLIPMLFGFGGLLC